MVAIDETQLAETSVQLLREFERTGDSVPFEAFMRRHAAMVYATCLKVTRDPHDAEDATQATFLTLASKSRLNGEIRQPEAWLRKVAHRLSLDLIRSKKRRINRENLRSEMTSEEAPLDSSDHAGNGELKGILNEELAKLPASYRMPLILHYFGGLSREEMADQLKLKPSTLGVRLHRAREQLRKRLSNRGIALPTVVLTALLTEVVCSSVCSHMMSRTARQASAIALGHAAAPVFSAGPGANSLRLITDLIGGSKLRVLMSAVVLGSAISMTSGQIQQFLPKVIRDLIPGFHAPSIPKLQFTVPAPRLISSAATPAADVDVGLHAAMYSVALANAAGAKYPPITTLDESIRSSGPITVQNSVGIPMPLATASVGVPSTPAIGRSPRIEHVITSPMPIAVRPAPSALLTSSAPTRSSTTVEPPTATNVDAPAAPGHDAWNSVLPPGSGTAGSGPAVPLAVTSNEDAPESVTTAVVGHVPDPGSSGGGGTAGAASTTSPPANVPQLRPTKSAVASRTITFAGTSANYGGYSDTSWSPTRLADLSQSLSAGAEEGTSFSRPTVPGEAQSLSINGARVTLHNASRDAQVSISFVDTFSTKIPTLPTKHHFIGVWEMDTESSYDAIDLLVRYDDLRAARMGLPEQILKLWVSDGTNWTLMWTDPTFGRDVYQNLLWVSAGSDVKFFAVSAPEPASVSGILASISLLSIRRRRA